MTDSQKSRTVRSRPRWWPAVFFLLVTAGVIVWARYFRDVQQQDKNIWTYLLLGAGFFCLLLWLLVLSNLPWRIRWISLGVVVLLHLAVFALLRIKGVDGNLVPIVEWRWKSAVTPSDTPAYTGLPSMALVADGEIPEGWPQFLGPTRDGRVAGIRLAMDWGTHPPVELWRVPVGAGWSGFAVSAGFAVTQEQQEARETVSGFEALTGRRLWVHAYEARYANAIAGEGPRATPSIDDGRVYAVGSTGWLTCLELRDGKVVWARNVVAENGGSVPEWGFSVSPLVLGNRVIVSVGGSEGRSLLALDKFTGETVWAAGEDRASYSSPILQEVEGRKWVTVFNRGSVAGHDLESGQLLWQQPYSSAQAHVAAPLALSGGRVLFSSGYGQGSECFSIQRTADGGWAAESVWQSRRMKAKFTNLIEHQGYIYGLDDGILVCIAADTGELQWKDGRYGHGQMILVGDALLVLAETGELVLVEPNPERLQERSRLRVFPGKTWNPPALAGNLLYLRTDQEAVCLRLTQRE